MSIEITFRHMEVNELLHKYAQEKAEKIISDFTTVEFVRIVSSKDGPFYITEVTVQGGRQRNAESSHRDADLRTAINGAVDRAETQIRRQIEKQNEARP